MLTGFMRSDEYGKQLKIIRTRRYDPLKIVGQMVIEHAGADKDLVEGLPPLLRDLVPQPLARGLGEVKYSARQVHGRHGQ